MRIIPLSIENQLKLRASIEKDETISLYEMVFAVVQYATPLISASTPLTV